MSLQLVSRLKAVFDRFDDQKVGEISGVRVEQLLRYMDRKPTQMVSICTAK